MPESPSPIARLRQCATLVAALAALAAASAHAAPPYRGRGIDSVLRELAAAGGFQLVYTSELVAADRIVGAEPVAGPPLETVAQVLAPLGLGVRRVDERTYVIVRNAEKPSAAAPRASPPETPGGIAEIIVTASRYSLASDVPDVHDFLTQGDMDALPRFAEDALKAVHRLPGAASNGLSGLAHMRGGEAGETQVLLDGMPLYEPFHLRLLQSPSSVLDERVLQGLDVYAGGFTAEYGDRMSAIIDARSLKPAQAAYYELGLSLMHANALVSHQFADGRGQWLASIRRSNLDEVADILRSDLGEPTYLDGFARIDYEWSPSTRGSLHTLLAADSAEVNNSADTEHADASYSNTYVWATLEHDWSERFTSSALLSFTDVSAKRISTVNEPGQARGHAEDRRDYDVLGLKLDARYTTERWMQRAGLDVRSLSATYDYTGAVVYAPDYPFPGAQSFVRELSPSPSGEHLALYYSLRGKITDSFTAEFGLRWDEQTYGVDADDQLAPRLNLAWRLGQTRLLASWGRYQQFQGLEELPVEDGVDEFSRAQHADHLILGIERDLDDGYAIRGEAYRKDYDRLRTRYENLYDPLSLAPELRWDRVAIAPASGRTEGLELLLSRRQTGPWNGWLGYALSRAVDRVDGEDQRRSWDQTHTVNAGIGWAEGPWQAMLAAQYHTGWPVTPLSLDEYGTVVVGPRNEARYTYFASIDARVTYEWTLPRGTLSVHGEITNALDRRNPCCTDYEYEIEDGAAELHSELRHWLPLVPSVGVLWKF